MSRETIRSITEALDADSVTEVTTYEVYIDGRPLRVEVLDSHEEGSDTRYSASVTDPSVPEADREMNTKGITTGNPARTIEEAVADTHLWIFHAD